MTPEYVDTSDIIKPDTRSDAQKWLDSEMDKRWANEQGAEPYPILEAIALEVIEENQRLRAQIGQGVPVAWSPALDYPQYEKERVWCNGKPRQEDIDYWEQHGNGITLAYTHPAPQQKPLTDEQIKQAAGAEDEYWATSKLFILAIARAIEAAHNIGEKK